MPDTALPGNKAGFTSTEMSGNNDYMQKLFITGAIASGKSTVTQALAELGAEVVDADSIVHELMGPGTEVTQAIENRFGPRVISADGRVDRSALAGIVFQDGSAMRELEAITHPSTIDAIGKAMTGAQSEGAECFAVEVQLLEKSGLTASGGHTLVVESADDLRLQRLEQKGLTRNEAISRMRMGPQPKELRGLADTVISNDKDSDDLVTKVKKFYLDLLRP